MRQTHTGLRFFHSSSAAGEDYSDVLAEIRVLKFKFQRRRRFIGSITEEQCFSVTILSDPFVEEHEVFLVQLSTDDSGVVLTLEEAEVVIVNNDCEYCLPISKSNTTAIEMHPLELSAMCLSQHKLHYTN